METTVDIRKARKVRDWLVGQVMRMLPGADPAIVREIVTEKFCSRLEDEGLRAYLL